MLDEFQQYNNTAGVFVGNEVLTTPEDSAAAPFVLAAARDLKSYRNERNYRQIPVGYSAADIAELRPMLQNYMACRPDAADRLDFFALNAYEWCGDTTYEESGYSNLQHQAEDYPIPIFFSETGCNVARPRTFGDQAAIFNEPMSQTWSGSIVYEWIQETNDYGIIKYDEPVDPAAADPSDRVVQDGFVREGDPMPIAPDFDNLKAQWATLNPTGVALSDYIQSTATIHPAECPASTAGGWAVDPSAPLPTLQEAFHTAAAPTVPTGTGSVMSRSGSNSNSGSITVSSGAGSSPTATGGPSSSLSATSFEYSLGNAGSTVSVPGMQGFRTRIADGLVLLSAVVGGLAIWL